MLVYCSYRITFIFFIVYTKTYILILVYCLYRYIHSTCSLFEKKILLQLIRKLENVHYLYLTYHVFLVI